MDNSMGSDMMGQPKPPPPQLMSQQISNNGGALGMGAGMGVGAGFGSPPAPDKQATINNLEQERQGLHPDSTGYKLLGKEIERVKAGRPEDQRLLDVHSGRPTKISFKVVLPTQEYPQYNFVGKILGPKGNSLKRLQDETRTKMAVLGRGSIRDKGKEEELRREGGKYDHLNEALHVWIEAFAAPPEAFARLAHAVAELKKFLVPDFHDDIRQGQLDELVSMGQIDPTTTSLQRGRGGRGGPPMRGAPRGGMPPRGGMGLRGAIAPRGAMGTPRGAPRGGMMRGAPRGRGAPLGRGAPIGRGAVPPARGRGRGAYGGEYEDTYGASAGADPYDNSYESSHYGARETAPARAPQERSTSVYGAASAGYGAQETAETDYSDPYGEEALTGYGKAAPSRGGGRGAYRAAANPY